MIFVTRYTKVSSVKFQVAMILFKFVVMSFNIGYNNHSGWFRDSLSSNYVNLRMYVFVYVSIYNFIKEERKKKE